MLGYSRFAIIAIILTSLLISSCTTEGDTVVVSSSSSELTRLEIRVTPGYPVITNIEIPLRCIAVFNNTAEQDWTNRVSWSSTDPTWGQFFGNGQLRVNRTGQGEVQVRHADGWVASANLQAQQMTGMHLQMANEVILIGEETTADIVATFADNSEMMLARSIYAAWSFTNPSPAHWNSSGVLVGTHAGQTVISASVAGVNSSPAVLIVDSVISIQCMELTSGPYLPLDSVSFSAIAQTMLTGSLPVSGRVNWESSAPTSLLPVSNGVFYALSPGEYTVTAQYGSASSPDMNVDVWNVLGLSISPAIYNEVLGRGDSVVFSATADIEGHGTQNFTEEVEWVSTDENSARFVGPGILVAKRTGFPEVYAKVADRQSQHVALTVNVPELFSDGFESYPIGLFNSNEYWELWTGNGYTRLEINDFAATGAQSCVMIDSSDWETCGLATTEFFSPLTSGIVEFTVYPGPGCWIWVGGPSSSYAAAIVEFTDGIIQSNLYSVGNYSPDAWYDVRVEFDCATDRYDLYVNDELLRENDIFYYSQMSLDHFSCYNSPADGYGYTYVDDFWLDGEEISGPMGAQGPMAAPAEDRLFDAQSFTPDSRQAAIEFHKAFLAKQALTQH